MLTLENIKTAVRLDGSEDDSVLTLLLNSAKQSMKIAGVREELVAEDNLDLYDQAIILYIEMDYETDDRKIERMDKAFQRILLQLKAAQLPAPDTTTTV